MSAKKTSATHLSGLSASIVDTLKERIVGWKYPPEHRLTEEALCGEFGVSRSPVREALRAPVVDGLYFPGYSKADAAGDLGDSAITETAGLGGFAMAAAPAIVKFVGGTPDDALAHTLAMMHITLGRNGAFTLPALNFGGTPAGIDARKVVDTGILPVINTGIAHKEAGIGQIGAGVTRAPLSCFSQAVAELARKLEKKKVGR